MLKKTAFIAAIILAVLLGGCSFFSGTDISGLEFTVVENRDIRPLPAVYTEKMAISYSGYRAGQSPGEKIYPTTAQIREDLEMLEGLGFSLIRLYDTSTHALRVLQVISGEDGGTALSLKVQLGAWLSGPRASFDTANMEQLKQAAIWAKNTYKDIIVAVSVGNECMVDWNTFGWSVPANDVAYYVSWIRERITQPVTVNDNWEPWSLENENGAERYANVRNVAWAVDFISLHTYPFWDAEHDLWDYKQLDVPEAQRAEAMMDASMDFAKQNFQDARDALANIGVNKPIVIGETGWMSTGSILGHPVNARMYWDRLDAWAYGAEKEADGPASVIYFEAFDEPWKGGDDGWGLFDVNRDAKYLVYSDADWSGTYNSGAGNIVAMTPFNATSDALYYIPPPPPIAVTTSPFLVFADDVSTGYDSQAAAEWRWEAWESNSTAGADEADAAANSEDAEAPATNTVVVITPDPLVWGWGMMRLSEDQGFDLSSFSAGKLRFEVKTIYAGDIKVGFQTGLSGDQDSMDCLITLAPGDYGYNNTDAWVSVAIPVSAILTEAIPSYGMPEDTVANLEKVHIPFVIADYTAASTTPFYIDQIRWTTN